MEHLILAIIWILAAYLIGSINFSVLVSRLLNLPDPRSYGSKNPGTTNVLRSGNKFAAALTLLFDFLKGFLPVFLLKLSNIHISNLGFVIALVMLAAFFGHLYPIFHNFNGGKGVATGAGAIFAVNWILGLLVLITWLLVVAISKMASLAAIIASISAPIFYILGNGFTSKYHSWILISFVIIMLFVILRHQDNINRIRQGKESKIKLK